MSNPKSPKRAQPTRNLLLSKMLPADRELVEAHLKEIELPLRTKLEKRQKRVEFIYFIDSGVASVVGNGNGEVEVGIIGRDGATGLSVVLAGDRANHDTYMQVAGTGRRLTAEDFRNVMSSSTTLTNTMLRYANGFLVQVTQTATANACGTIPQRLARWLLMVQDRVETEAIPLTHEFLAIMLAVNRPGVTLALKALEDRATISQRRGSLTIVDRAALEMIAGHIYETGRF
ncbi:Crp/Fnr family transcriptional regulator [Hyphomicrobium sp. 99]|uniref:Crp/Fnr family transcriptional regulator n=1 Tax=Hyphomicrobium sp. 99 TaxID=1163419 RepID=UPI0005F7B926|nr:Crp/Fnr family transcriptional regulator [Hyphomicrobium sp. 99]